MNKFDILIIGSGPAGLWAAEELLTEKPELSVAIIEKGKFSSGGMINDCKLNITPHVGMNMKELQLEEGEAWKYIHKVDNKFVELGADKKVYGEDQKAVNKWMEVEEFIPV